MLSVTFAFLQAHVQKLETTDMLELRQRLVDSKNCLAFLIECVNFSPADIRLNNSVFQWYGRMGEIFDEHRKIIKDKTEQYQEALKVGIIDFSNCSFFGQMFGFLTLCIVIQASLLHGPCIVAFSPCNLRRCTHAGSLLMED